MAARPGDSSSTRSARHRALSLANALEWATVVLVGFLAAIARPSVAASRYSLFAEDAPIFLKQSRTLGVIGSLHTSYAGYYQLLSRLIAAAAVAFPIQRTPVVYVVLTAATAAACAAITRRLGVAMGLSRCSATILAAAMLLLPAAGYEVVDTVTNLQWFILATCAIFFAAWTTGYRPPTIVACCLIAVAGMTTPLLILLVPIGAVVALVRRTTHHVAVLAVTLATCAIQLAPTLFGFDRQPNNLSAVHPRLLMNWYAYRVVGGSLVGDRLLRLYYDLLGLAGVWVVAGFALTGLLLLSLRGQRVWRLACLFLLAESMLLFVVPLALRGYDYAGSPIYVLVHARYMAAPALCLFAVLLMHLDRAWLTNRLQPVKVGAQAALALIVVVLAVNFSVDVRRLPNASWVAQVRAERTACSADPRHQVVLRVAPDPSIWRAILTCRTAFPG